METLPLKFVPRVLVVDDHLESVKHLTKALSGMGIEVVELTNASEAREYASKHVLDVCLLDVVLNRSVSNDRSGVLLGEILGGGFGANDAGVSPEAVMVFISRPNVLDTEDVLRMFNLRLDGRYRNSRVAEGFAEKTDGDQVIRMVCHLLSNHFAWEHQASDSVNGSAQVIDKLKHQLDVKFREFVAPHEQFIRLVRELCLGKHIGREQLEIREVSKGRSRSIVINTLRKREQRVIDSRILKIGSIVTIKQEIECYKSNVPRILRGGSYPLMVGTAFSRQLGAICYSDLGGGGGIPDSFGDIFWDLKLEERMGMLNVALHDLICDAGGPTAAQRVSFSARYLKRFQCLSSKHGLHNQVLGIMKKVSCIKSVADKSIELALGNLERVVVANPVFAVKEAMMDWTSSGYLESVVHGDFHPDNLLIYRKQLNDSYSESADSSTYPFLIDFTHTDVCHAALDYIIMDAMLRSQSLKDLLSKYPELPSVTLRSVVQCWVTAEFHLCAGEREKAKLAFGELRVPSELILRFNELLDLSHWLRECAKKRLFTEGVGFYLAGFGFVCYSFLSLPDRSDQHKYIREILVCASAISFDKAIEAGVGDSWLTPEMEHTTFLARLADVIPLLRSKLVRSAHGDLSGSEFWRDEVNARCYQFIHDELSDWLPVRQALDDVKRNWSKDTASQARCFPAILDCILFRNLLDILSEMGFTSPVLERLSLEVSRVLRPPVEVAPTGSESN